MTSGDDADEANCAGAAGVVEGVTAGMYEVEEEGVASTEARLDADVFLGVVLPESVG